MARFLFAWELGGDYGHLSRLLPIALGLRARGHTVDFAVRDLLVAETLLTPHGLRALQAPLWLSRLTNMPDPISYAEMLMRFGFLNPATLTGICRAWRHLVDLLRPDVLVLDHAPTALLATRGLGLPRANIGTGFCIPPDGRPMPAFRWWTRENPARVADSERHVLQTANAVMQVLNAPPLVALEELARCDLELLCSFPELDHYAAPLARGAVAWIGPLNDLGQGAEPVWPDGDGPRVFAYLKGGFGALDVVLGALKASGARVLAHVPGAARKTLQVHTTPRMRFSEAPLDMRRLAEEADLAVCHAGAGTASAMLLAGKPLLLLPMQLEQLMVARCIAQLGAAVLVPHEAPDSTLARLRGALADTGLREAAARFASAHAHHDTAQAIAGVVARCEALSLPAPALA
jgi:UDP:flavonoid glycosyltransferase YjiC (YdhE family)